MNYGIGPVTVSNTWINTAYISATQLPVSVWYSNTHGTIPVATGDPNNPFESCIRAPAEPKSIWAVVQEGTPELASARQASNGSGLPPLNTGNPPFRFAFIDACWTGGCDNSYAEAMLFPYTSQYSQEYCRNQSLLGYKISQPIQLTAVVNAALWAKFREGGTAFQARAAAHAEARSYVAFRHLIPIDAEDYMAVWGDFAQTLYRVYPTDYQPSVPRTEWFRPAE